MANVNFLISIVRTGFPKSSDGNPPAKKEEPAAAELTSIPQREKELFA